MTDVISKNEAKELGLKRYFTGKQCKHGHVSEFYVSSDGCVLCSKNNGKKWFKNNKDQAKKLKEAWIIENPEKCRKYVDNYRFSNPDKIRDRNKRYYKNNKEKESARCKKYKERNPESVKLTTKKWRINNPQNVKDTMKRYRLNNIDKTNARTAKHKAIKLNQTPELSDLDNQKIYFYYQMSRALSRWTGEKYHVDHVWPLNKGGVHHWCNLQVIPAKDNLSKLDSHDGVSGVSYQQFIDKEFELKEL